LKHNVVSLSRLHKAQTWYEKPVQVTVRIKKSTFIILGLVVYILWSHLVSAAALPPTDPAPIQLTKIAIVKKIPTIKSRVIKPLAKVPVPAPKPAVQAVARPSVVSGCGDNSYAHFIYEHESGCNTGAVNALGCRGIGQACPGSKLPCGADYACQNAYFTNYAISTYGSWANAYSFWLAHSWW